MESDTKRFVRKKELARALGVSPRTVDNWLSEGIIPVMVMSPRLHLFDVEAVQAVLSTHYTRQERRRG